MAKKKGRKKDDIGMAYSVQGPRGMTRATVYRAMIEAIQNGTGKLPPGVKVVWKWRNSKKQDMRAAPFAAAIRKSRAGFLSLMLKRITRDAMQVPGFEAPPPPRMATAKEIRAIERAEERTEEKRERAGHRGGRAIARERELRQKRSAAAKKGWETRRAAARRNIQTKPRKGRKH